MLTMTFTLLLIALQVETVFASEELVYVQTLWRHGDRIPHGTYPSDPYQKKYWGMPWGEITEDGLQHQFQQGENIRKLYIDSGFLSAVYNRDDVLVRSADSAICLQSALSNLAGFYSDSPGALDSVQPKWPTGWTPVPVHTVEKDNDRELQPGVNCAKAKSLSKSRQKKSAFQDFLASNWNLFALLAQNGGQGPVDTSFDVLSDWYDTLRVEKEQYNLTFPSWITDDVYNQLKAAFLAGNDYTDGDAGFGIKEDKDLIKLRGGFLLDEWRSNLQAASEKKGVKYHAYSAKEHTINALLNTLGAKKAIVGDDSPRYTATLINELWKKKSEYHVKFLFIDDASSPARDVTKLIDACTEDPCPLQQFLDNSAKMSTSDATLCDA